MAKWNFNTEAKGYTCTPVGFLRRRYVLSKIKERHAATLQEGRSPLYGPAV